MSNFYHNIKKRGGDRSILYFSLLALRTGVLVEKNIATPKEITHEKERDKINEVTPRIFATLQYTQKREFRHIFFQISRILELIVVIS